MTTTKQANWRELNRANWDERVSAHLGAASYSLDDLRAGRGMLHPIEEAEIGPVEGLRILHLQCHFGRDTLTLAQRGANIVGLDFSPAAVKVARELAAELGLSDRAQFIESDVYDALNVVPGIGEFDRVYVTWGAICWLPDLRKWAEIIAKVLKIGGRFYMAEGHPSALVFDDADKSARGLPGYFAPYFLDEPLVIDDTRDYASDVRLENTTTVEWMHPLGAIVTYLCEAGLSLSWLHEHDSIPWRMFEVLVQDADGMYRWPSERWLPLGFSLEAVRVA